MRNVYHTLADMAPFSIFEEYTCRECNKEWMSNEGIIGICPICRGDMDIYYNSLTTCLKCLCYSYPISTINKLLITKTGNKEGNYDYYCQNCEDYIAKEAVMRNKNALG